MKRILVIGAGLVAGPLIQYLAQFEEYRITLADRDHSKTLAQAAPFSNVVPVQLDVQNNTALDELIQKHELTVSLLPASMHPIVARICVKLGKHMTTASYISPEMMEYHDEAKSRHLVFLNECGLDPGLDHMSAMQIINKETALGGKIVSFKSYCGGLPAPSANTNPLGYKFSWSPKGVLSAATKPARYLQDGIPVDIPGNQLFRSPETISITNLGDLEGYPNRDALTYKELYGLTDAHTMLRGTLRYPGHCAIWYSWVQNGLLSETRRHDLENLTLKRFMQGFADGAGNIEYALAKKWDVAERSPTIETLNWLGMFNEESVGIQEGGNVDILANQLTLKCQYSPDELDMVVMRHDFIIQTPTGNKAITSSLVEYGTSSGPSAMAKTVSIPLAVGTKLILDSKISHFGVIAPIYTEIFEPVLEECEKYGIGFHEETRRA